MDKIYLVIINFSFYLIGFILDLKIKKKFSITSLLWLVWMISTFIAIFYYSVGFEDFSNISFYPYLYLFFLFLISIWPIYKFQRQIVLIHNYQLYNYFIVFIALIAVLPFIDNIIHLTSGFNNANSIVQIYDEKMSDDFDNSKFVTWYNPISKIFNSICLQLQDIIPIMLFLYLTKKNKNNFIIAGLIMASINPMLYSIALSGRGMAFGHILLFIALYILFKEWYSKKVKIWFSVLSISIMLFFIVYFINLSFIRLDAQTNNLDFYSWISLYFGESTLNFNSKMWNAKEYMYGDYSFSFYKSLIGLNTFDSIASIRDYWSPKLGFSIGRFFTFIGDIYGDFGPYITIFYIMVVSFLIYRFIKNNKHLNLLAFFIFIVWYRTILMGFTINIWGTQASSQRFLEIIVIGIFFSVSLYDQTKKKIATRKFNKCTYTKKSN